MNSDENHPLMSIQCDWDACLRGREKEAWISCKYRGQPSVTGKLQLLDGKISCTNGFDVMAYHGQSVTLRHLASKTLTTFVAPSSTFPIHDKSCTRLAVTTGGLGMSSGSQGELHIWEVQKGVIRRSLEGHVGDIYRCAWFPSEVVVLAGGADWRTRIWCAQTGRCPVTLTGHTGPVTDLAIIDRGKNVITTSKDGTARLWDVGESQCLAVILELQPEITCCIETSSDKLELPPAEGPFSEREVGTEERVLVIGCEDGTLVLAAIRARAEIAKRSLPSPIMAIALVNNEIVAVGMEDGQVHLISILCPRLSTKKLIHETNSSVKSLITVNGKLLLVGLGDGCCVGYGILSPGDDIAPYTRFQLTGSNFEPINDLAWPGRNDVYTAARDGCVRKYSIRNMIEKLFE